MGNSPLTAVLRHIRRVTAQPGDDQPTDRQLLERFTIDRDEAAFTTLLGRHGPMVLGVCRGILRDAHAAEDSFQATFLILARKAGSIRGRASLSGWLYQVARHAALRARSAAARREQCEKGAGVMASSEPWLDMSVRELQAVVSEEVARLPEKYRTPLVLCYLEGKTQDEAARLLGESPGAVKGRLERGRQRLRARLTKRGLALPAGVFATLLAESTATSQMVAPLVVPTVRAALAVALGETAGVVPAGVASLAEGVIKTMTVTKLQWGVGVFAICGALTAGGVWATGQRPGLGQAGKAPAVGVVSEKPMVEAQKAEAPTHRLAGGSQRQRSLINLKRIMLAIHNFEAANGFLPADIRDKDGKPLLSWRIHLLPYLEQVNLYQQFKRDEPWDSDHNVELLSDMPNAYRVGIEPKDATHTYYQAFAGPDTPLHPMARQPRAGGPPPGRRGLGRRGQPPGRGVPPGPAGAAPGTGAWPRIAINDIPDGLSNTLGVVEAGPPVPWTKPADIPFDPAKPLTKLVGPFSNALHAAMMDGSAWALKRDIDEDVFRGFIQMNDGMVTPPLNTLRAAMPAETAEEKEQLRKHIVENQQMIDQLERLMKENVELLSARNGHTSDLIKVEDQAEWLKRMTDSLREQNKTLRDDLGLRPGAPVPKPPDRPDK